MSATQEPSLDVFEEKPLVLGKHVCRSRLFLGTVKYRTKE